MDPPSYLETISWLTKDYIEEVLRKNYNDPALTVESYDVPTSTTKGDNYASIIQRIAVTYRDSKSKQKRESFIVKSLPAGELMQSMFKEMRVFEKESSAYSKLIPAMKRLSRTPIASPKFFATDRENIVILEDMSSQGFRMADRRKRLDLEHSILALKALAKFHALSWAIIQEDPDIVKLFPQIVIHRLKDMDKIYNQNLYKELAVIVKTWPGYERFSEKILALCDEIQDRRDGCLAAKDGAFNVLIHGDCWVNNMLFRYNEETQNVEEVCLIDLQIVRYASPAVDLQYFLASSLADGIRNNNEDELLEVYHQELIKTLESVGVDSNLYSLDDLKRDYDEKAFFGFHTCAIVLGVVAADPSEAPDFGELTEDSLTEEDSTKLLKKMLNGEGFKHVFQNHLLYYEKTGFF